MPRLSRLRAIRPVFALFLLPALALGGCQLIDQTTFYPQKAAKPVAAAPMPVLESDGALLTISLAKGTPDYEPLLAQAVKQALAAKPDIEFRVVSFVPQHGDTPPSWDEAEQVTQWGRRVADTLKVTPLSVIA